MTARPYEVSTGAPPRGGVAVSGFPGYAIASGRMGSTILLRGVVVATTTGDAASARTLIGQADFREEVERFLASLDREAYAALADELNDPDVHEAGTTLDDFDAEAVEAGARYAEANGLRWPPGVGDYDRFYEAEHS